jgi:hypothetical protein
LLQNIARAGEWFLQSGIQDSAGGVARFYRADLQRNQRVSTEITGYAVSTLVYLHKLTGNDEYIERAVAAARFLTRTAWCGPTRTMPFEVDPAEFTYFFDCGIIVRGLLAAWRATAAQEFLEVACAVGESMAGDFVTGDGEYHPILALPGHHPVERDGVRWSRNPGCYQLKSAMAWWDLYEATGRQAFRDRYDGALAAALASWGGFLPGHAEPAKVMDRLHAFAYFLEGLLPRSSDPRCATALCEGIRRIAHWLREIGPEFERSDVYAQLLRIRMLANCSGAVMLDECTAAQEAERLAGFQSADGDPRLAGGFYFGRAQGELVPHLNPVSTAFALQALALWEGRNNGAPLARHMLI